MEIYPKFIIENGKLIMGKVDFHKKLVEGETYENVRGGGWFRFFPDTNTFDFYNESVDFGKAKLEDIKAAVESGNVFTRGRNISQHHNFSYENNIQLQILK